MHTQCLPYRQGHSMAHGTATLTHCRLLRFHSPVNKLLVPSLQHDVVHQRALHTTASGYNDTRAPPCKMRYTYICMNIYIHTACTAVIYRVGRESTIEKRWPTCTPRLPFPKRTRIARENSASGSTSDELPGPEGKA